MVKTFIFTFLALFSSLVSRAQIHVGPGQAYPTIAAAASARAVRPGDTVFVHAGTYSDANALVDSLIGTPENWITIEPYQAPGSQPDSVSIHVQYTFQAAQYLRISGLHFYGNDRTDSAYVFHLLFFDYQYICFTSNHDILIENCTFDDLNNVGKGNTGACLKIDGTAKFQVLNCAFRNGTNITDGISLNADSGGDIRGCTFENMPGDGSHCKGGAKHVTYEKNLFINCAADGVDVGGDTGPQFFCPLDATWEADSIGVYANVFIGGNVGIRLSSCHHAFIFNNTCFKSNEFAFRSLNTSETGITLDSNYVYNNIFTTYSPYGIYLNAWDSFQYNTEFFKNNLFHAYLNADPASISWSEMPGVNVAGTIIGDPDFTDTASGDFSLKPGSLAIDAGTPTAEPLTDYNNIPYSTSARSIGAFEFQNAGVNLSTTRMGFILSPNPCGTALTLSFGNAVPSEITIMDALGRETMTLSIPGGTVHETKLDVSPLADGVYTLLLTSQSGTILGNGHFVKWK